MDVQEQLVELRRKIARIDRKYVGATPAPPPPAPFRPERPARYFVEEMMSGNVIANAEGEHFQTEKLYHSHRRHGSMDISNLIELPEDLLDSLSGVTILRCWPASPSTCRASTCLLPITASHMTCRCSKPATVWPARARPSPAWRIWTCCTARAVCGNCAWKAAAWWSWKIAFWAWSAKAICPA